MDEQTAKKIVKGWIEGLAQNAATTGSVALARELKFLADSMYHKVS